MIVRLYYHSIYTNIYTYTQPHVKTINEEITEENRHFTHPFIKKESYNSGSKFLTTQYIRDTTFLLHINQRFSPSLTHTPTHNRCTRALWPKDRRDRVPLMDFSTALAIYIYTHTQKRARARYVSSLWPTSLRRRAARKSRGFRMVLRPPVRRGVEPAGYLADCQIGDDPSVPLSLSSINT